MLSRTHTMFGVTTLAVAHYITHGSIIQPHRVYGIPLGVALCTGMAVFGALLPDIDAEESAIEGDLGLVGAVVNFGLKKGLKVKHRGVTHYGITCLLVLVASTFIGWLAGYQDVGLAFGLGYLSHALADAMTSSGVPFWWPLSKKKFHLLPALLRVRTGSSREQWVFLALGVILFTLVTPPWMMTILIREATKTYKYLHHITFAQ